MGFTAGNVETPQDRKSRGVSSSLPVNLDKQEIEIILLAIKTSTFRGDALPALYKLVDKLEKTYIRL